MNTERAFQTKSMIAEFMKFPERWHAAWLKFDESWDALMPVVEKIEERGYRVEMNKNRCTISIKYDVIVDSGAPTKLEAVYASVSEFIYWYNNQKGIKSKNTIPNINNL